MLVTFESQSSRQPAEKMLGRLERLTRAPAACRRLQSTLESPPLPPPPHARAGAQWQHAVTPEMTNALLRDGYYVVPDAFPAEYLRQLRDEMKLLRERGQLYPNSTHVLLNNSKDMGGEQSQPQTLLLEKHDILETELALNAVRDQQIVPFLRDFFDQEVVFGPLRHALPTWLGLEGHMVKLQHNAGRGACFPMHFDTYGDDGKCVTAVLYLNEHWQEGDGGEIVLYPFPKPRVVVAPRFGQLVLFSSQQMLHRVLPAIKPRYCLTTWTYASPPSSAKAESAAFYSQTFDTSLVQEKDVVLMRMLAKILRSPFRRHLAKLLYAGEWEQSLRESHLQTEAFTQYMETHRQELAVIEAATTRMLNNFRVKDGGSSSTLPATIAELEQCLQESTTRQFLDQFQLPWF